MYGKQVRSLASFATGRTAGFTPRGGPRGLKPAARSEVIVAFLIPAGAPSLAQQEVGILSLTTDNCSLTTDR